MDAIAVFFAKQNLRCLFWFTL